MKHLEIGVENSLEKEGFTSYHNQKVEDRKEPKFDILLQKQGDAKSLTSKRSQSISFQKFNHIKNKKNGKK